MSRALLLIGCLGFAHCQGFYSAPATSSLDASVSNPSDGRALIDAAPPDADKRIPLPREYIFTSPDSIGPPFQPFTNSPGGFGIDNGQFAVKIVKAATSGMLSLALNQFAIGDADTVSVDIVVAIEESAMMPDCPIVSVVVSQARRIDVFSNGEVCDRNVCQAKKLMLSNDTTTPAVIAVVLKKDAVQFIATTSVTVTDDITDISNASIEFGANCDAVASTSNGEYRTHYFTSLTIAK